MTPFVTAKVIQKSFVDVLGKHKLIIEKALTSDALIMKVCQLPVHVDYTDAKLRRKKAVYICTTDLIAGWTHNNDLESLGEI